MKKATKSEKKTAKTANYINKNSCDKANSDSNTNATGTVENVKETEIAQLREKVQVLQNLNEELKEKYNLSQQYKDGFEEKLNRLQSEFENYRKRTAKEKAELEENAENENLKLWLSIFDNLSRAIEVSSFPTVEEALEGIKLIHKQAVAIIEKLEIQEVGVLGESFDPNLHTAIMHEENESFGENQISMIFEKGYKRKDKLIRPAVVKVAN